MEFYYPSVTNIYQEFSKLVYKNPELFEKYIGGAFEMAKYVAEDNAVNKLFIKILSSGTYWNESWDIEEYQLMIQLGADPQYNNYEAVRTIWRIHKKLTLFNYLVAIYDINFRDINLPICYFDVTKLKMNYDLGVDLSRLVLDMVKHSVSNESKEFILSKLLENVADIDVEILTSALRYFISHDIISLEQVKILVEMGADPRFKNDNLTNAIINYRKNKNFELADYLIDVCQFNN
jgi:hypothetical protein